MSCPECSKGPRDRTCGITVAGNRGIAHCYRCQYVGFRDGVPAEGGRILSPTSTTHARLSDYGLDLWNECVPLADAGKPDKPGLYIARSCEYFWATVPYLARDQKRVEDVDSSGPDHAADACRYGCLRQRRTMTVMRFPF